jgi:vacuolar protein sorting-associated protein 13A/C
MFQGLLENLLQRVIGEYVEAIDPKKLNMSVYSGVVDLTDLNLKKNIFSKVNLPIRLVIGRIKRLFVKVPWNALSSTPVQIQIEGLQLLIEPLENSEWEEFAEK